MPMRTQAGPDYYQILGVRREADLDEIKRAYHRLAARCHPDVHPDDPDAEAALRSLNEAYAVLRDPERRARYDRWGAWGPPAWHPPGAKAAQAWMAAVVGHLFTAHAHLEAHKPRRGQDLRYSLAINPQDGLRGCEARLDVPNIRWCPQCLGGRMAGGKPPFPCPQCRGAGEIRRPGWLLSAIRTCDLCQGEAVVITDPCRRCLGEGSIPVRRTLTIDIPPGVRHGSRLRVRGAGYPGRWGGSAGDLYIDIRCVARPSTPHPA
jgi:molecular chaperone DnaJ